MLPPLRLSWPGSKDMALPIYELPSNYAALADLPIEAPVAGQTSPQELEAALDEIRDELVPKLLSLAKVVRTLEAEAELLEEHGRALMARAGTRRRRLEFLKRWMQLQMEGAGVDRAKDAFVTVWLQASPPSIDVVDEAAVPAEFKRVTLKMPLSLVPPGLVGLVQTCDVDRMGLREWITRTGEVPNGVAYRSNCKHLRLR